MFSKRDKNMEKGINIQLQLQWSLRTPGKLLQVARQWISVYSGYHPSYRHYEWMDTVKLIT